MTSQEFLAALEGLRSDLDRLDASRKQLSETCGRALELLRSISEAGKQPQEGQMSFNLQYLQLQNQMQYENRSYTAISNIMKTKHDTVKNSISNIK